MIKCVQTFYPTKPIRNNLPEYIEDLNEHELERIETLDKYWLILLRYLDNSDKHRQLYLTSTTSVGGSFPGGLTLEYPEQDDYFVYYGIVDDGTELARFSARNQLVDFVPIFGTAFGPGVEMRGEDVVDNMSRRILYGKSVWQVLHSFDEHISQILNEFDVTFFK